MNNKGDNEMIGLKDLFFEFMKRWRWVVFTALVTGILFGGARVIERVIHRESNAFKLQSNSYYESAKLQYDREKNIYEDEIKVLHNQLEALNDYYENAPIMRIESYNKYVASADVFITVNQIEMNNIYNIIDTSLFYFNGGGTANEVSGKSKVKGKYIQDLITAKILDGSKMTASSKIFEESKEMLSTTKGFHVNAIGESEEAASLLLDEILNSYENEFLEEIGNQMGLYKLNIIAQGVLTQWDDGLGSMKNDILNSRYNLQKEIRIREDLLARLDVPEVQGYPNKIVAISGLKYALLGTFVGGVIGICIAFITCYYSDKLKIVCEQKNDINKAFLIFPWKSRKRGIAKQVDYLLNYWQYRDDSISEDVAINIIASMIKKKNSIETIGIITDVDKIISTSFQACLEKHLPQYRILLLPDVLHNANLINDLEKCDYIMLLEDVSKARNSSIRKKELLLSYQNKEITMCLMLY